jgi:hypothetical protein
MKDMRIDRRAKLVWLASLAALAVWTAGGHARAGEVLDCAYDAGGGQTVTLSACASVSPGGELRLQPGRLSALKFDGDGLAAVFVGPFTFYVSHSGRTAPVARVEGKAAEFHDGLAPSPRAVGGHYKIGYIDKNLALVIPAHFDGGLDFDNGHAQVCRGCSVSRDGEIAEMQGGVWGCIDMAGREVVPLTHPTPDDLDCASAGG